MSPMLELDPRSEHADRLRGLLQRFRSEERSLQLALRELQVEIEFWQREAAIARLGEAAEADRLVLRCREMQEECDHLAIELAHVRLAQAGAAEELATLWDRSTPSADAFGDD